MRKLIARLCDRVILWGARHSEVSWFDGIRLADLRNRGDSFRQTLERSLRLVREHDPRRYARITRFIHWIVNRVTIKGSDATYDFSIRACHLEFYDDIPALTGDALAALYACVLIHESTHGLIESRGIEYCAANRVRVERLCVKEQNRFAARLAALDPTRYPIRLLAIDFDAGDWQEYWTLTPLGRSLSLLAKACADKARTSRSK